MQPQASALASARSPVITCAHSTLPTHRDDQSRTLDHTRTLSPVPGMKMSALERGFPESLRSHRAPLCAGCGGEIADLSGASPAATFTHYVTLRLYRATLQGGTFARSSAHPRTLRISGIKVKPSGSPSQLDSLKKKLGQVAKVTNLVASKRNKTYDISRNKLGPSRFSLSVQPAAAAREESAHMHCTAGSSGQGINEECIDLDSLPSSGSVCVCV